MIQLIMKDGSKKRLSGNISDPDITGIEYQKELIKRACINENDIQCQKELTDEEIHMIPEVKSGKIVMRNKNSTELSAEQTIIDDREAVAVNEKILQSEMREMAKDRLVERGDMSQEDADKI